MGWRALVDAAQLAAWLDDKDSHLSTKVIDGSWHMPATGRNAASEFEAGHIQGAVFADLDRIRDQSSSLPHMLPSAHEFAAAMGKLGIAAGDRIVVYDTQGMFSAARWWWSLRLYGAKHVYVLHGGLPAWIRAGLPLEQGAVSPKPSVFEPVFSPHMVTTLASVESWRNNGGAIVDARSPSRFSGKEAEPRAGLRSGHIPGSANVHYASLLAEDGTFLPAETLRQRFLQAGIDPTQPVVASCGSGVTACILALALHELGNEQVAVYDGSWADWGREDSRMPVAIA